MYHISFSQSACSDEERLEKNRLFGCTVRRDAFIGMETVGKDVGVEEKEEQVAGGGIGKRMRIGQERRHNLQKGAWL